MNRLLYANRARLSIVGILRSESRYFTALEIFERLKVEQPKTAMSTVYRTLDFLEAEAHHHHAICRVCGNVDDVACAAMDEVRRELERRSSFEMDDHTIEFHGRCYRCRATAP